MRSQFVLRFPATSDGFENAATQLRQLLDTGQLNGTPRRNVELAFEEIATNIVRHAKSSDDVEVTIIFGQEEVALSFVDNGVPFDPREQASPKVPASLDEAQLGGLGLVLVRNISTRLSYARTPEGRNNLIVAISAR